MAAHRDGSAQRAARCRHQLPFAASRTGTELLAVLDIGDIIEIGFAPELLAELDALLAQAAIEQAKQQPRQ